METEEEGIDGIIHLHRPTWPALPVVTLEPLPIPWVDNIDELHSGRRRAVVLERPWRRRWRARAAGHLVLGKAHRHQTCHDRDGDQDGGGDRHPLKVRLPATTDRAALLTGDHRIDHFVPDGRRRWEG